MRVPGIQNRLNTRTETKITYNSYADFIKRSRGPLAGADNTNFATAIWGTTGADTAGNPYLVLPTQGVGSAQRIGLRFNYRYMYLNFIVRLNDATPLANGIQADDIPPFLQYRIMVVQRKSPATNFIAALPNGPLAMTLSIDTRIFKIHMDKVYTLSTGAASQWFGTAGMNLGTGRPPSPPRLFRMKIPLKQTVNYDATVGGYLFPSDIGVFIVVEDSFYNDVGGVVYPFTYPDRVLRVTGINTKMYYTDE